MRVFLHTAKLENPDVAVCEVRQSEKDGDHPIIFVFSSDVSADVQAAMEIVLRKAENLQKLSDFNYDVPHKLYPIDVIVGLDPDVEGNFLVSISSRNSTFSR